MTRFHFDSSKVTFFHLIFHLRHLKEQLSKLELLSDQFMSQSRNSLPIAAFEHVLSNSIPYVSSGGRKLLINKHINVKAGFESVSASRAHCVVVEGPTLCLIYYTHVGLR